jgi:hypothetical protein
MNPQPAISLANRPIRLLPHRVILAVVQGHASRGMTELIARLALRGPFHLISSGHWLPDQDSLRRAVRRYTLRVNETLDHLILGRPATCLQLRDQLIQAELQPHPVFALNFLNHFFDPDVELSLRQQVLGQCCQLVKHLSAGRSVVVLVEDLPTQEYQEFLPRLASIADEVLRPAGESEGEASQLSLL